MGYWISLKKLHNLLVIYLQDISSYPWHDVDVDLCAMKTSGAQQGVTGLVVHSSYSTENNGEAIAEALRTKGMKLDPSTDWWQSKCLSTIDRGCCWRLTHFKSSGKTPGKRADLPVSFKQIYKKLGSQKCLTAALWRNSEKIKWLGLCHRGFRVNKHRTRFELLIAF